jgi:multiple sugar transport system permease protein
MSVKQQVTPMGAKTTEPASRWLRLSRFIDRKLPTLMILPAVIILLGTVLYPFIFNINLSLHQVSLSNFRLGNWPAVGLNNFLTILNDPFSQAAFVRTLLFALASVTLQVTLGLIGALAFNVSFRGKGLLMTLALVPMMITPVAVGLSWRMLLNTEWGIINYLLNVVGIASVPWLSHPTWAFVSIVIVQLWWGVSFIILLMLGGLSSLSPEPYEAAAIDGASPWQSFRFITLPLMQPVIIVAATIRIIDAFREFDVIYTLTGGGPAGATRVFALQLYYTAFERGSYGLAAAQAIILVGIILLFTTGLMRSLLNKN